jgi:Fic family protein
MNGNYTQLYKLSKQIQRATPELEIYNPYKKIIEKVAVKYHPSIQNLFYELLQSMVRLRHLNSRKDKITVSRDDVMITLNLMKQLLLPVKEKEYTDASLDTYGLIIKFFGDTYQPFTVMDVYKQTKQSLSTVKRHLRELADSNILERIPARKKYYYKINK